MPETKSNQTPEKTMTKSSTLTQVVMKAEVTPEQKHQRVIDWLNEVHKVLYKNLDLTKHTIKVRLKLKYSLLFARNALLPQ